GPLPPEDALGLLEQIAAGLAALHGEAIVHGALGPDAVMLVRTPKGSRAVITDWFAGQTSVPDESSEPTLPPERAVPAPEPARRREAGTRAEVLALAPLAQQVVTGAPALEGPNGETPRAWRRTLERATSSSPARRADSALSVVKGLRRGTRREAL